MHYWIIVAICSMPYAPLGVIYNGCFDKDIIDFCKVQMRGEWGKNLLFVCMLKIKCFQCLEWTVYAFKAKKDIIMYKVSGDPVLV
jgi:hypothetical protein